MYDTFCVSVVMELVCLGITWGFFLWLGRWLNGWAERWWQRPFGPFPKPDIMDVLLDHEYNLRSYQSRIEEYRRMIDHYENKIKAIRVPEWVRIEQVLVLRRLPDLVLRRVYDSI